MAFFFCSQSYKSMSLAKMLASFAKLVFIAINFIPKKYVQFKKNHIFYLDRSKKFSISYNSSQLLHPSQCISAHKTEYYGKFISRSSVFKCIIFLKFNYSLFIFCLDEFLNICMDTYDLYI